MSINTWRRGDAVSSWRLLSHQGRLASTWTHVWRDTGGPCCSYSLHHANRCFGFYKWQYLGFRRAKTLLLFHVTLQNWPHQLFHLNKRSLLHNPLWSEVCGYTSLRSSIRVRIFRSIFVFSLKGSHVRDSVMELVSCLELPLFKFRSREQFVYIPCMWGSWRSFYSFRKVNRSFLKLFVRFVLYLIGVSNFNFGSWW